MKKKFNIAVIGLGYVGLPLVLALSKKINVIAYDKNKLRVNDLLNNIDTNEDKILHFNKNIEFTDNIHNLSKANCYIICVPTPIFKNKKPNLNNIFQVIKSLSKVMKKGDLIILESTVYPGFTNEELIPLIESLTNFSYKNKEFLVGYSPERINPSDKVHTLENTPKIVSSDDKSTLNQISKIYSLAVKKIIKVQSIKVAESAKIIENIQRDINISLINELHLLFYKMNIDTNEVLEAAESKWNFLPFKPGLVGGHCIGVDPYYLVHKANKLNIKTKTILSGRDINEKMHLYILKNICIYLNKHNIKPSKSNFLVLGCTFKENCKDIRNSGTVKLIKKSMQIFQNVDCYEEFIDHDELKNIKIIKKIKKNNYQAIFIGLAHDYIVKNFKYKKLEPILKKNGYIFDFKNIIKGPKVVKV